MSRLGSKAASIDGFTGNPEVFLRSIAARKNGIIESSGEFLDCMRQQFEGQQSSYIFSLYDRLYSLHSQPYFLMPASAVGPPPTPFVDQFGNEQRFCSVGGFPAGSAAAAHIRVESQNQQTQSIEDGIEQTSSSIPTTTNSYQVQTQNSRRASDENGKKLTSHTQQVMVKQESSDAANSIGMFSAQFVKQEQHNKKFNAQFLNQPEIASLSTSIHEQSLPVQSRGIHHNNNTNNNTFHVKQEEIQKQRQPEIKPPSSFEKQANYRLITTTTTQQSSQSAPHTPADCLSLILNQETRTSSFSHKTYTQLKHLLSSNDAVLHFTRKLTQTQADTTNPIESSLNEYASGNNLLYTRLVEQRMFESRFYHHLHQESNLPSLSSAMSHNEKPLIEQLCENVEQMRELGLTKCDRDSDSLLKSFEIAPPNKEYEVYKNLSRMCELFIRGEKRKRFQKRNSDSQYMSRFHNLNRLFFYQVVSIYSYESISCLNISPLIANSLRNIICQVKIHSRLQLIKPSKDKQEKRALQTTASQSTKRQSKKITTPSPSYHPEEPSLRKMLANKIIKIEDHPNHHHHHNSSSTSKEDDLGNDQFDGRVEAAVTEEQNSEDAEDCQYDDFPIRNMKKFYQTLKVEAYTHSHYNVLFLKLTPESMQSLKNSKKEIEAHWLAYRIDLRFPNLIPSAKLEYTNLMKSIFYKIFIHFNPVQTLFAEKFRQDKLADLKSDEQTENLSEADMNAIVLRLDYYIRVTQGIQRLSEGIYSHKF